MKNNALFNKKQFGFISGRSTALQLIKTLNRWTSILDDGNAVDVISCDFMKAFDNKVAHRRLIEKIKSYGIGKHYQEWIRAFLSERQQRVIVNGNKSSWRVVTSGVPQGSVLGPLLFVIFINDLPECVTNNREIYLYADETKVFRELKDKEDCERLQQDINDMYLW